ncbi:site-specific integrase [Salmonella enterica]|nr:integrase [Salmonella enterica subsp. enterica serovar Kokomlemle]EEY2695362.1 site-specific integrase [Salmonella enterica]EBU8701339.1 integrase [Salmonella enterica subsp. enterica serovar Kokomlemle]EFQ6725909.1 site-specific integrase [Salmonella enterica]EFR2616930.1 site-specific integrase [Salmonella enterica]
MATENKLSDTLLRKLHGKLQPRQKMMADGRGLSVRVSRQGGLSFVFTWREGGRTSIPKAVTLGRYPDTGLKQARQIRDRYRVQLAEQGTLKLENETAIQDGPETPAEEMSRPEAMVTVREALEYWFTGHAKSHRKGWKRDEERITKYVYSTLGGRPVDNCGIREWVECFEKIRVKYPVSAGAAFQVCRQALRYCRLRGYTSSRVLDDFRLSDMGSKGVKRERVLNEAEVSSLWSALQEDGGIYAPQPYLRHLVTVLVIFGCRTHEIRESTWSEWDLKRRQWTIPKSRTKNGHILVRPVPERLMPWLECLKGKHKEQDYVLGQFQTQMRISKLGSFQWQWLGHEQKWRNHDIRRTVATWMNDAGVNTWVVEHLLGHAVAGVAGIYNRAQYLTEKKQALDLWLDRLLEYSTGYLRLPDSGKNSG